VRGHLALQVDRDPGRARAHAAAARTIGHDSGVIDLEMMALALEGLAYVCEGEVEEGMRRLDEATAAAVAGELDDLDAISSCCCCRPLLALPVVAAGVALARAQAARRRAGVPASRTSPASPTATTRLRPLRLASYRAASAAEERLMDRGRPRCAGAVEWRWT
jgi:hypothetical protein